MASLTIDDLKVVDADTHFSEPHDLWTSRVPAAMRDAFPHVVERDGQRAWLFNGDDIMSAPAGSGSSIRRDGTKKSFWQYNIESTMQVEEASQAAYDPVARLEMMDEQRIWAQIIYPNVAGFAANRFVMLENRDLANAIVSVYNDAVAEMQAGSGGRLFPRPWCRSGTSRPR